MNTYKFKSGLSLLQKLELVNAERVKAHLYLTKELRSWINELTIKENKSTGEAKLSIRKIKEAYARDLLFLDDLFAKIEDNYWFWVTLRANWDKIACRPDIWAFRQLKRYYDAIQLLYRDYYKEEKGKTAYLNFITLKPQRKKISFNSFWNLLPLEINKRQKDGSLRRR